VSDPYQPRLKLQHGSRSYAAMIAEISGISRTAVTNAGLVEDQLSAALGGGHVVHTPMCRTGIYLLIKQLVEPGQEVIMSPYTIADVINMVLAAGAIPVFADVDRETCNLSPAAVADAIGTKTGAVLVTHLHGIAAEIEAISELCRTHHVALVEDAAQAFGAEVNNRKLGTFGDAGVFSFGMYKNINSWFGGAVWTDRSDVAAALKKRLAHQPRQTSGMLLIRLTKGLLTDLVTGRLLFSLLSRHLFRFGLVHKVRLINRFIETELDSSRNDVLPPHYLHHAGGAQLQLICQQLPGIEPLNDERRHYAKLYWEALHKVPGLILAPFSSGNVYSAFPIQVQDRHALLSQLLQNGCDVAAQHLKNCADLDSFAEFAKDCPRARACAETVILLPTWPGYGESQVRRNIAAVVAYCGQQRQ
jgi:perosamine synthetase